MNCDNDDDDYHRLLLEHWQIPTSRLTLWAVPGTASTSFASSYPVRTTLSSCSRIRLGDHRYIVTHSPGSVRSSTTRSQRVATLTLKHGGSKRQRAEYDDCVCARPSLHTTSRLGAFIGGSQLSSSRSILPSSHAKAGQVQNAGSVDLQATNLTGPTHVYGRPTTEIRRRTLISITAS